MGVSVGSCRSELYQIMKFLIVSALVAAVSAEAQYAYSGYPYAAGYAGYPYSAGYAGYPYAAAAAVPFGSSTGLDPITQGLDPVTQGYYGKRDAEPEADAQAILPYAAGYAGYPYAAGYAGYTGYAGCPYTAGYGYA